MRPYHPNNLSLTPYAGWRVIALAWVGKFLGVQFHVGGIPFGAAYRPAFESDSSFGAIEGDPGF